MTRAFKLALVILAIASVSAGADAFAQVRSVMRITNKSGKYLVIQVSFVETYRWQKQTFTFDPVYLAPNKSKEFPAINAVVENGKPLIQVRAKVGSPPRGGLVMDPVVEPGALLEKNRQLEYPYYWGTLRSGIDDTQTKPGKNNQQYIYISLGEISP